MTTPPLMKAPVCRRYGPPNVVEIADVPRPTLDAKDVLIKGFTGPRSPILGAEVAGEVVAVGAAVTRS